ncbi:putative peptide/nitrate transporter, partial [Trifolium pratense]
VEVAERFAYYGISSNLITYLTGPLGQSTVTAAENVNIWAGTASLLPLLGAFLADSFLGRYRTIIIASLIYILALSLLTLSAILPSDGNAQAILFFVSLYLVAFAQGGHKPCVQAFGADQFDINHPEELRSRCSFFNWWYFTFTAGCLATINILNYVQDNVGWLLGFGIPCIVMLIALSLFLLGTWTYRFTIPRDQQQGTFSRIGRVFIVALTNFRITQELEPHPSLPHQPSQQF